MSRLHVFADEAGNFDFSRGSNISRYFIVCSLTTETCALSDALLSLRRDLAWRREPLGDYFHATEDKQIIRDTVFDLLRRHDFTVQATILEKSKAAPKIRPDKARFYQYGWYYHFLFGMREPVSRCTELHVTAASVGTKKGQNVFSEAVRDVVRQTTGKKLVRTSFWPCSTDPCLQAADYCTWAIQRKWEIGDTRSYDLIKDRITYEYDTFQKGTTHYY